MKITFENLGKIEKATIEINDLTILVGDNNSGKTYLTYSTYGAIENWKDFINYNKFKSIASKVMETGQCKLNQEELLELISSSVIHDSKKFKNRFKNLFNDKEELFENSNLKLEFEYPKLRNDASHKAFVGKNMVFEGSVTTEGLQITLSRTDEFNIDTRIF
ncbi:hypothetical protein QNH98_07255 [Myroides sp. mNGS23_01]|nr:hypothetical protein [Myroides sp. mNGS23_01]WHT40372.1 hypothetical protein QNH98_07255 [Myroides sp. mNGS23_01]